MSTSYCNTTKNWTNFTYCKLQYHEELDQLYVPPNPFNANMLALLENGDDADISFRIGEVTIPAHVLILRTNAPVLADLFDGRATDTPVSIEGISPSAFRDVLRFVYGGNPPDKTEMLTRGKGIIDAANRFGIAGLKVAVENTLVASGVMRLSNVADYLLFADAQLCPLLKECATSYFVTRANDILNSKFSKELQESPKLLQELIRAVAQNSHGARSPRAGLSVGELRTELGERNLDVDGSKEMLVARLESAHKRRRTD